MKVVESIAELKRDHLETLLKGDHALIHLDARHPGVVVPDHLKLNPMLTLKISYLFQGQLNLTPLNVEAYLRFSGTYFQCIIPWEAVWGISDENQEQRIWVESLPPDLLAQVGAASGPLEAEPAEQGLPTESTQLVNQAKKPQLKRIK